MYFILSLAIYFTEISIPPFYEICIWHFKFIRCEVKFSFHTKCTVHPMIYWFMFIVCEKNKKYSKKLQLLFSPCIDRSNWIILLENLYNNKMLLTCNCSMLKFDILCVSNRKSNFRFHQKDYPNYTHIHKKSTSYKYKMLEYFIDEMCNFIKPQHTDLI